MELFLAGANPARTKGRAKHDLRNVTDTMENAPPSKRRRVLDEGVGSASFGTVSGSATSQRPSVYERARQERQQEKIAMIREMERSARPRPGGPSRIFDQDSSMRSVELEFNRQKVAADTANATVFMKNILMMLFTGIEMANKRFGPWLELNGWSGSCQRDMDKYDAPLSRIYARIFRHGSINPFLELGMLVGGSLIMYHAQQKMLNPTSRDRPTPAARPRPGPRSAAPSSSTSSAPAGSGPDVPKRKMKKFAREPPPSAKFMPVLDEETTV